MKRLADFAREETGEEWLRELYKVIAARRGTMFRMITESARILLFGNAGGVALVIGLMGPTTADQEGAFHILSVISLLLFAIGTLSSAITMILVTLVSVREAHSAETGLKRFLDSEMTRSEVMFSVESRTFKIADFSTVTGGIAGASFILGGLIVLILISTYF